MKVLIANRGEIAVRIMRACREMGFPTVAVYSDCDRMSPHVRYADEAIALGGNEAGATYLRIDKIINAARCTRAAAIHPGYGFLAENSNFASSVENAGIRFIGPPAAAIALMGGKTEARTVASKAGVPIVPGSGGPLLAGASNRELSRVGDEVGFPLFIKAVAGGGGKGMRFVEQRDGLHRAIESARSEAEAAFGNGDVYIERAIERGRHIEVQLLADNEGTVVPFVERECSLQRRHQKVIEETPSVAVGEEIRHALAGAAASLAREVGYTNAGTIEFLLDSDGNFYFLEMNTRLQVEHPVTELVTGVDLVNWQLRIASGEKLSVDPQKALQPNGHAIECRVYAEDPSAGFLPSPGRISFHRPPSGPGVRVDAGVESGFKVPVYYDSMMAKVIVWGENRNRAIDRMQRALTEYEIGGVPTTIPLFRWILSLDDFSDGRFDTTFLDRVLSERDGTPFVDQPADAEEIAVISAAVRTVLGRGDRGQTSFRGHGNAWRRFSRSDGLRR